MIIFLPFLLPVVAIGAIICIVGIICAKPQFKYNKATGMWEENKAKKAAITQPKRRQANPYKNEYKRQAINSRRYNF